MFRTAFGNPLSYSASSRLRRLARCRGFNRAYGRFQ